jgi:hypothetical protein
MVDDFLDAPMPKPNNKWVGIAVSGRAMRDRHPHVNDTDHCAHRGAIDSCSGWIVGKPDCEL